MEITLKELVDKECQITDITAVFVSSLSPTIDYSRVGRNKNLLFYCIKGPRKYYDGQKKYLLSIEENDVLFITDKLKYITRATDQNSEVKGICLCFYLRDASGKKIKITDSISVLANDKNGYLFNKINKIYLSVLRNQETVMGLKALFFDVINTLVRPKRETDSKDFKELYPAIEYIENNPQLNTPMLTLANMCCMSESSFYHKFLKYSGGISPLQYRNRIRIMRAEEMANDSNATIEDIADALGFYDASHLCRYYKKFTGKTIKNRNTD